MGLSCAVMSMCSRGWHFIFPIDAATGSSSVLLVSSSMSPTDPVSLLLDLDKRGRAGVLRSTAHILRCSLKRSAPCSVAVSTPSALTTLLPQDRRQQSTGVLPFQAFLAAISLTACSLACSSSACFLRASVSPWSASVYVKPCLWDVIYLPKGPRPCYGTPA
jgi:hypothetical protein